MIMGDVGGVGNRNGIVIGTIGTIGTIGFIGVDLDVWILILYAVYTHHQVAVLTSWNHQHVLFPPFLRPRWPRFFLRSHVT